MKPGLVVILILLAVVVFWLLVPAFEGFHIGYNAVTDRECLTRLVQWCR